MRFYSVCILLLVSALACGCAKPATTTAQSSPAQSQPGKIEQALEQRLKTIADGAQGKVGLCVIHIESGKTVSINGNSQLPL